MKRFESDRSGRLVVLPRTRARAIQQATDEAQRILGETEPNNPRECGYRWLMSPLASEPDAALAESLAAFVALDLS